MSGLLGQSSRNSTASLGTQLPTVAQLSSGVSGNSAGLLAQALGKEDPRNVGTQLLSGAGLSDFGVGLRKPQVQPDTASQLQAILAGRR